MKWVPLHLVQQLKKGGQLIACQEPRTKDGVAWVWVASYKESDGLSTDSRARLPPGTLENEPWHYLVRAFEAPKHLIDSESEVADEVLIHDEKYRVETLDDVDELLER